MRSNVIRNALLIAVPLCFIGHAQQDSGQISGLVKDQAGTPIANAIVTVRGNGNLNVLGTAHTDVEGRFSVSGLTPQITYDLFVQSSGFQAIAVTRMVMKDAQIPIVMTVADLGGVMVMSTVELPVNHVLPEVPTVSSDIPKSLTVNKTAASEIVPIRFVTVRYPRLALFAVVQGRVELEAILSSEGAVKDIKVISGHPLLKDAAKNSLEQWRFAGCRPSGVACTARVTFVFVLEKGMCDIDQCPNHLQIDLPGTVTITSKPARAIVN
jgi:TonB family protein